MNNNPERPYLIPVREKPWTWIAIGWIGAVLIPIVGFVCAIVLLNKDEVGNGIGQLILSIFMCLVWMSV